MWLNPQFSADLVTFTGEIFNGKLYFLCSVFIIQSKHFIKLTKKIFKEKYAKYGKIIIKESLEKLINNLALN